MAKNKIITIIAVIAIAVSSFTVLASWATSEKSYVGSMESLDKTKKTAVELSLCAVGAATTLAMIPGDATTPMANKLMDVAGYTVIIFTAIVIEKYLLTLTGALAFKILIPLASLLVLLFCFCKDEDARRKGYRFAARLAIVGLLLWALVPVSVKVSNRIEKIYQNTASITENVDAVQDEAETTDVDEEASTSSGNAILDAANSMLKKAKSGVSAIAEYSTKAIEKKLNECKLLMNKLLEGFAVMIVTTCVIPICVLFVGLWIVKMLIGVSFSMPKMPKASNLLKKTINEKENE